MSTEHAYNEDNALFLAIAEGDETAYTQIFHLYTPRLLPFIFKLTKDEQLAREVLQETFLRLWMKRDQLPQVERPASWLFRIAANICLTWLRTQATRHRLQDRVEEKQAAHKYSSAVEVLESKEMALLIRQAVDALPARRQEIYRLSREQGLSHQQIAERLQLSLSTVKNQLGYSIKFIQEYLHNATGLSLAVISALFLC
ncbi:MAG: RNA polymerase sigma-70 factor [Chitinophagaceae bacterium]|nr:RNA polymerase sigma-70 factor [Chitinophagaceae bacterium]